MNAKDYKYVKPTTNEIVFAIVVKKPHWIDRPNQICKDLPVGAITWIHKSYIHTNREGNQYLREKKSVCPEANRYGMNFEPSCFELLPTFIQKVRRR